MTRAEICAALDGPFRRAAGTRQGDLIADLLALAFPDDPPCPDWGFGDPLEMIRGDIEGHIRALEYVARQNSAPLRFREEARAFRAALALAEGATA